MIQILRRKQKGPNEISFFGKTFIHLTLGFYALICIVPLLLIIAVSMTDEKIIALKGYNFIPEKLSSYAYEFIFSNGGQILNAYGVTIFVTVAGTVLSLMVISLYAYVISRKDFQYRGFFTILVFLTMLFNGGLVSTYLIGVNVLHLKDNLFGLIFPYLMNAWWVLILRTFFVTNIPDSIIESAKIDGAGELRTFFNIVLPLALPGLATIALFSTLQYWNDWWLALLYINDPKLAPLPYLLYKVQNAMQYLLQNSSNIQGGFAGDILSKMPTETARMAMVVVAIGPIVLTFPFFQKYFIKGLTVGAIKG